MVIINLLDKIYKEKKHYFFSTGQKPTRITLSHEISSMIINSYLQNSCVTIDISERQQKLYVHGLRIYRSHDCEKDKFFIS